jgi:PAS domain S-box-containing protein
VANRGKQLLAPNSILPIFIARRLITFLTRRHWNRYILLGMLTLFFTSPGVTAGTKNSKKILLLYGSEKDLPMNVLVDRQLRTIFKEKLGTEVELYSEYLDRRRFPDNHFDRNLIEFLRDKYPARGLDLIVVVESFALDLIQSYRESFFPTTPVVFCCMTESEYIARTIGPGVTGIPAKLYFAPTLDIALRLQPSTRRVVVIAGASEDDRSGLDHALRDFQPFKARVEIQKLVGLPMRDLRQEVSQLSGDTIIICLTIAQDGDGTFFLPRDALDQISQVATVPIYGYFDSWLGHGIVGGYVASFDVEAKNAAQLGMRILAGEKPENLSAEDASSCAFMFDWRQLKRWGIDEGVLPPGSAIRFHDPSFWDQYHWQIIGVLSVCVIQAALIVGLLLQRIRRRRAELETKKAEEQFRLVVESVPNAIVMVNAKGAIVLVNSQCEKYFGYGRSELLGRPIEILVPDRLRPDHSDGRDGFLSSPIARVLAEGHDLQGRRKDESEFPADFSLTPIHTGAGAFYLCAIVDITARKEAEETREELAHASRLALMGELTASIAHEINQPLGAILSNADAAEMMLESSSPAFDQVRDILSDIRKDDVRASEVIRRLRVLLSKHEMESRPLNLNEVMSEVLALIRAESRRRGVTMESNLDDDLPLVRGDRVHLQQVLLNLVFNGMEAMANSPVKRITLCTRANENGSAEVEVSDTGPGIRPDRLTRVFDAFFTTKKQGMGLGLSIARSLVHAHGGQILAENTPDGGATFRVTFPTCREPENQEPEKTIQEPVKV